LQLQQTFRNHLTIHDFGHRDTRIAANKQITSPLSFRVSPIHMPTTRVLLSSSLYIALHVLSVPPKTARDQATRRFQLLFERLTAAWPDSWSGWKGRQGWRRNRRVLCRPGDVHGPSSLLTSPPGFAGRLLGFAGRSPSASRRRRCLKGRSGAQNGGSCCLSIRSPVMSSHKMVSFFLPKVLIMN
jgi:hypothetical protein